MDTNELIAQSQSRFDFATAKRTLREKYQAKLVFAHAGGLWRTTPEMIVFLDYFHADSVVIPDLYENPIRVQANELAGLMRERWQEQMSAWLVEFEALTQNR